MRPLTRQEWDEHYTRLRGAVAEAFPEVDEELLDAAGDDLDRVVEIVQRRTGLPAEVVEGRLRRLDVAELGIGTGGAGQAGQAGQEEGVEDRASLDLLRLSGEFTEDDRGRVVERLSRLNRRLRRFPADGTDLHLTVKDRDSGGQKVTLEAWLPKFGHFAATSTEPDLRDALMDVREDMWRQIDDAVNKRKGK